MHKPCEPAFCACFCLSCLHSLCHSVDTSISSFLFPCTLLYVLQGYVYCDKSVWHLEHVNVFWKYMNYYVGIYVNYTQLIFDIHSFAKKKEAFSHLFLPVSLFCLSVVFSVLLTPFPLAFSLSCMFLDKIFKECILYIKIILFRHVNAYVEPCYLFSCENNIVPFIPLQLFTPFS